MQQQHHHHGHHNHKVNLPLFWTADPAGWFLHTESKFLLMGYMEGSHTCYLHMVGALQPDILLAVRDITRDEVTALTPTPYNFLKAALTSRYSQPPLQQCYELLSLPPLGDRHPAALFTQIMALVPEEGNALLNTIFLRLLPENMRAALNDKGHLLPRDLAAAAALLHHPGASSISATGAANHTITAAPFHGQRPPLLSPSQGARTQMPRRGSSSGRNHRPLQEPPASSDLCIFHYNFKTKARNCKKPCAWRSAWGNF
jgi:hypothetical protein